MSNYIELFENYDKPKKDYTNRKFKFGEIGEIRYRLYDDDVVVFMGSYVDQNYRGQGIYTKMLYKLLSKLEGKKVYVPISNPNIINLFKRLGFEEVDGPIRYWGVLDKNVNYFKQL